MPSLIKKRLGVLSAALLLTMSLPSAANEPVAQPRSGAAEMQPYVSLAKPITGDAKIVRVWFSFSCNHCARFDQLLGRWGGTLPPEYRFVRTPLAYDKGTVVAAMAYYAALYADQKKIQKYMDNAFTLIHQRGQSAESLQTYVMAAGMSGINLDAMQRWYTSPEVAQLVKQSTELAKFYQLQVTPTVGVAGKWTFSPEITGDDKSMFIQVLNALVSKDMIETKKR